MAVNMFLFFEKDGVDGESSKKDFAAGDREKWIECISWSYGVEQPTNPARSQSGATLEQCTHNPFNISRRMDSSSIFLLRHCWKGTIFPKIIFEAYRSSEEEPVKYLSIEMYHGVLATYEVSGSEGDIPEETITINYGEIGIAYIPAPKMADEGPGETKFVTTSLITGKVE